MLVGPDGSVDDVEESTPLAPPEPATRVPPLPGSHPACEAAASTTDAPATLHDLNADDRGNLSRRARRQVLVKIRPDARPPLSLVWSLSAPCLDGPAAER